MILNERFCLMTFMWFIRGLKTIYLLGVCGWSIIVPPSSSASHMHTEIRQFKCRNTPNKKWAILSHSWDPHLAISLLSKMSSLYFYFWIWNDGIIVFSWPLNSTLCSNSIHFVWPFLHHLMVSMLLQIVLICLGSEGTWCKGEARNIILLF